MITTKSRTAQLEESSELYEEKRRLNAVRPNKENTKINVGEISQSRPIFIATRKSLLHSFEISPYFFQRTLQIMSLN
jgi:hypothetical protein